MTPREQRLLAIETARVRHAWAKAQIESAGATPALIKSLKESLNEKGILRPNDVARNCPPGQWIERCPKPFTGGMRAPRFGLK